MYHRIANFFQIEEITRSANIALAVPICAKSAMNAADYHIVSYVEFPSSVKERTLDVFLQDEGLLFAVSMSLTHSQ